MFAVYCDTPDPENPLAALRLGERPEPEPRPGWVRVRVTHASLNRHDLFTLCGVTGHATPIPFPMILGNDAAGCLDDGTAVVLYPVIVGESEWGDETLTPSWRIFSEREQGTFADYVLAPQRNVIPLPPELSPLHAAVLGTAWLTAWRMLCTKSGLRPGQTMLVQGATGGMATALVQLGRTMGMEVWVTSRSREGRELALQLGAHQAFEEQASLPRKAHAVFDNVGRATWAHSLASVRRGGTIVTVGITSGGEVEMPLLPVIVDQLTITGSVMGSLAEMHELVNFVARMGIVPEICAVLPMEQAADAFAMMAGSRLQGKVVLTR
ncbi:quinone oxidoreductase family protein [Megalodesulfovibrio gigas]|uniref:Putative zinc-binding dehydrogenase family protein n=1 Tax=Megalodesulfovibrio gigas (strain ATCC 19364 / DSM 1382 / NCIMB 9332 / VKM B-1759) TaxID=1121448 RepID=T2GEH4_MEGG1|nr:zinc-binding dehydrogenase [Megalodesulfovibrio gigas]AGW14317.1 putative zinc-binding dehydrogenase family protein [Megalodesulfovibrio gigas DSM 1382 = ATCC 19364]